MDLIFPEYECQLRDAILQLHEDWSQQIIANDNSVNKEDLGELYVNDGFYPEYTKQPIKILFIGKEGLEVAGQDYIRCVFEAYHNKIVGCRPLNQYQFHATMLYISYALKHKVYEWNAIPYATEFVDEFGMSDGCSFAFMNISKLSNESGQWQADEELIDTFGRLSQNPNCDYFAKEIGLLNPDVIIGMNLGERMKLLGEFSNFKYYGSKDDVCFQTLTTFDGKSYIYLDVWHFSAPRKSPERDIFTPIIESLKDNSII